MLSPVRQRANRDDVRYGFVGLGPAMVTLTAQM
jgi:hypothetical protein